MLLLRIIYADGSWSERWMRSVRELDHCVGEHLATGTDVDLRSWESGLELVVQAPPDAPLMASQAAAPG